MSRANGCNTVHVVVVVDEHAVATAERTPQSIEPPAEIRVLVAPGVPGQTPVIGRRVGNVARVAQRSGDDRSRPFEETLGMTGHLRPRHREPHTCEQPAGPAFDDVTLRVGVGLDGRSADDVEAEVRAYRA